MVPFSAFLFLLNGIVIPTFVKMKTPYTHEKLIQDFSDLGIEKADTLFIRFSETKTSLFKAGIQSRPR